MSFRFRRASVRLAVGLVAAAIPLAGAGVAQAALAGANPLTTTSRPDLRSASLTGATSAQFCFDKAITSVPDIGGFIIGGYRGDAFVTSTTASASGNCVNATFPARDVTSYSFAQVGEGAVRGAGNVGNRADSVALAGTSSQNGTRGLTTAPDLTGISVVSGAPQQIAFTFDQPVNPSAIVGTAGFHFVTSSGTPNCPVINAACDVPSNTAAVSTTDPKTVIAQFPVGATPLVTNAVRGYIVPGAVSSATGENTQGTWDSAPNAGSGGVVTGVPTLLSANTTTIGPSTPVAGATCPQPVGGVTGALACQVVDYTFNEAVSVNNTAGSLSTFYAYLSDGSFDHPVALTEPSGTAGPVAGNFFGSTTVRAYYAVASLYNEYLVKAGVSGSSTTAQLSTTAAGVAPFNTGCDAGQQLTATNTCAVVSTTTGHPNTPGSAPIGGNTGGHATGFSTAPDAFGTAFDTQTNTVSVTFDSRVYRLRGFTLAAEANQFQLLDANGNAISGANNISACSPSTIGFPCSLSDGTAGSGTVQSPGTNTVWLTYPSPAVQVGNAKALEIRGWVGPSIPGGFPDAIEGGDQFGGANNFAASPGGHFASDNLQQIVSPSAVAANVHLRASNHWSHKRATAAFEKSVLAKTKHHIRKHHRTHH